MEIAYFLGCIMNNRYPGIEKATRMLFDKVGIELKDMEEDCLKKLRIFI